MKELRGLHLHKHGVVRFRVRPQMSPTKCKSGGAPEEQGFRDASAVPYPGLEQRLVLATRSPHMPEQVNASRDNNRETAETLLCMRARREIAIVFDQCLKL